jgi:hypothetical protein
MKNTSTLNGYILFWAKKIKALRYLGAKCFICGNEDLLCLEFHHNNGKSEGISEMIQGKGSSSKWSDIVTEIEKCVVVCRNCHAELHGYNNHPAKNELLEICGQNKCSECGYQGKSTVSLEFHHKLGDKKFRIANCYNAYSRSTFKNSIGIEIILEEIKKCVVVCRNCHTKIHINSDRFYKTYDLIEEKIKSYKENNTWDIEKLKKCIMKMKNILILQKV